MALVFCAILLEKPLQAAAQQIDTAALPSAPGLAEAPQSASQPTPTPDSPANIQGVVVDPQGAVYEGVHVTLTLSGPGSPPAQTISTDSDGRFQFSAVAPGPFKLTIASQGFATQEVSGVLHPGESYEAKAIVLPFASATSEVRVTASREEVAEAELKEEEQQRVFGVLPNFYIVYAHNAPPLNPKQKFRLAWRSSIDPTTLILTGAFAGFEQASDEFKSYGQGASGYAKRYGANYADDFIGTMIGAAILPSLLKQDPRYFVKGTGTVRSRIFYALANSVVCKGDNGRWQFNVSAIGGGLISSGISNLYYPASDRNGVGLTFQNQLVGMGEDAIQNIFQEFLIRKLTPKVPNYAPANP